MAKIRLRNDNLLEDNSRYYWSPSVKWRRLDNEIRIEVYAYSGCVIDTFPEFYYITQNGIVLSELVDKFKDVDKNQLTDFIIDLIKNKILVKSILTPQEIFFTQNCLFESPYNPDTFLNPEEYHKFKDKQLSRAFNNCKDISIPLECDLKLPEYITGRKSYRTFDEKNKISFKTISTLLSAFKQYKTGGAIRYNYATAGGLYPIDMFIYFKDNRVENIKAGLYYYNPIENALKLISDTCVVTDEAHYFTNKPIFNSSAFSIYLIYSADVTMPKYSGMGYFYACIDTGIMVGLLTQVAEHNNIGLCSIGDMNFKKIEKYFKLNCNQVFLHDIEVGIKAEQKEDGGMY